MFTRIYSKIQYPKLLLFALCILLAYVLTRMHSFEFLAESLNHQGYFAAFLGGCLFSYGFTTPFAIALFIEVADTVQIPQAALLAASGALLSDFLIFSWVKFSMEDEFQRISLTRGLRWIKTRVTQHLRPRFQKYLALALAGIIIGSPLPDEIGVSLLSGFGSIDKKLLAVASYTCNFLGITTILLLA